MEKLLLGGAVAHEGKRQRPRRQNPHHDGSLEGAVFVHGPGTADEEAGDEEHEVDEPVSHGLQRSLGGRHAGLAGVLGGGGADGAGDGFEFGFGDVVGVAAVVADEVEVDAGVVGQCFEEVLVDDCRVVSADDGGEDVVGFAAHDEVGAAGQVDDGFAERFIHGHGGGAEAGYAAFVAECIVDGLAEDDGGVFDGVVAVDLGVAGGVDADIDERVVGECLEHVIEEGDASLDVALAGAVEVYFDGDGRFLGCSFDAGDAVFSGGVVRPLARGEGHVRHVHLP